MIITLSQMKYGRCEFKKRSRTDNKEEEQEGWRRRRLYFWSVIFFNLIKAKKEKSREKNRGWLIELFKYFVSWINLMLLLLRTLSKVNLKRWVINNFKAKRVFGGESKTKVEHSWKLKKDRQAMSKSSFIWFILFIYEKA